MNLLYHLCNQGEKGVAFDAFMGDTPVQQRPSTLHRASGNLQPVRQTMMRKVDPVHFFKPMDQSPLTMGHQSQIIHRLLDENAELKRLLKTAMLRLGAVADEAAQEDTLN